VTYHVSDRAGNAAIEATRTVVVDSSDVWSGSIMSKKY